MRSSPKVPCQIPENRAISSVMPGSGWTMSRFSGRRVQFRHLLSLPVVAHPMRHPTRTIHDNSPMTSLVAEYILPSLNTTNCAILALRSTCFGCRRGHSSCPSYPAHPEFYVKGEPSVHEEKYRETLWRVLPVRVELCSAPLERGATGPFHSTTFFSTPEAPGGLDIMKFPSSCRSYR
jgi:hypothetical protein